MTDTNPRDLIQSLSDALDNAIRVIEREDGTQHIDTARPVLAEARAYLAQPEPEGPTAWMYLGEPDYDGRDWHDHWEVTLDEKLARYASGNNDPVPLWRTPAIKPVPVSERLPKPEDCDAEGRCWWGRPSEELCNSDWFLATRAEVDEFCDAWPPIVFLPHWALPVPIKAS